MFENMMLAILGCAIVAILGLVGYAAHNESSEWENFKTVHKCKVVAAIKGETFNTVGFTGNGNFAVGIGSTTDKTGWLCDNGITYYR